MVFVVFGLVYIVIVVVYYINKWQTAEEKAVTQRVILIAFGGLCYYIGDNLPPIIVDYADELSCGEECV